MKTILNSIFQVQNALVLPMKPGLDDQTNDYRLRRQKNNESVRKSREKNRALVQECAEHVQVLKNENVQLNDQLNNLQNELYTLKNLFQHCFSFNLNNLAIKPSEIPTSTLYKIIMKKDMAGSGTATAASTSSSASTSTGGLKSNTLSYGSQLAALNSTLLASATAGTSSSSSRAGDEPLTFDETDQFYITQIKNALSNIVKSESLNKINSAINTLAETPTSIMSSPVTSPGQSIPSSDMENTNLVNFSLNDEFLLEDDESEPNMKLQHSKSFLNLSELREHDYVQPPPFDTVQFDNNNFMFSN